MPTRIDLNAASREELTQVPGIGDVLAERILATRDRLGRLGSIDDLATVPGLTAARLGELAGRFTVSDRSEAVETGFVVEVVCTPPQASSTARYTGHRVQVLTTRSDDGLPDRPVLASAATTAEGVARVELPPRRAIAGPVEFSLVAPDGRLLASTTIAPSDLTGKFSLKAAPVATTTPRPNDDPNADRPTRLRGRVLDAAGKRQIAATQVVVWGARTATPKPEDFIALTVGDTDGAGYFSGPYPLGTFTAAHATVAVDDPPVTVAIHLEGDAFPESVILVVDAPDADPHADDESDCACQSGPVAPRDPDHRDLGRADGTFSSDPGAGRCVDFTVPDRTLEEFTYSYVVRTTEPEIKGLTLDEPGKVDVRAILDRLGDRPILQARALSFDAGEAGAAAADVTAAAAPVPAIGTKLDAGIVQRLARDPDGFSLTSLVQADRLSRQADVLRLLGGLANRRPGRNRLDARNSVDWDDDPTVYQAATIAHGHVLRFKQEWVADGYSMGNLLYSLPLAPGQKKLLAVVDWERREENARTESLVATEALDNVLSRDRDINEIVRGAVTESTRGGSSASSGGFGGGFGLGFIAGAVGGLLGIGGGFSSADSSAWQDSSRSTAANALNQLRDRTVQSASSVRSQRSSVVQTVRQGERVTATTETVANYNHCHAITIQYFEVLRHLLVRQRLTDVQECLFVPLLMSRFTSDKARRWRNTLVSAVPRHLRPGFAALDRIANGYAGSDLPIGRYADENLDSIDGELTIRFQLARPRDDQDGFDASQWVWIGRLLPFVNPQEFYKRFLKEQAFRDRVFLEQLGPQIASTVVQNLKVVALRTDNTEVDLHVDATMLGHFVNDAGVYVSLRMGSSLDPVHRADIKAVVIRSRLTLPGLPFTFDVLPAGSRVIVESGSLRYRTAHLSDALFSSARILNDLTGFDDVRIPTPLNSRELRNPREEDKELARNLLDHLNEHIEEFHHAIWWRMSADRRYMLLDGFEAPNSGGRSVASVVENELIGIVGNSLVMPVARGFHLDPTFRQDATRPVDLIDHYQPNTPIEPSRVALPTRGVYAEAVMGACNSCEEKREELFWRWEESPIPDSPPSILPVSTDTRRAEPPDMTAKDLPSPLIALQNAPAAPDPTGLAAAFQLLGTSGLFKDITGLEGTQRNAAAALSGALDTAKFFGGKAADLALQGKMTKDIDKSLKAIQAAKTSGLIDDAQAKDLTRSALSAMVGGGASTNAQPTSQEELKQLTDTAGRNNAAVTVSRPNGERVEVDAKPSGSASDTVKRSFILLPTSTTDADTRAFHPKTGNRSGIIDVEVQVPDLPVGGSVRWSAPEAGTLSIDSPSSMRTRVRGIRPGKTALDIEVRDASGNRIESQKLQLSVPQFVTVGENVAEFDNALTNLGVQHLKDGIVQVAHDVCNRILGVVNVRTVWNVASIAETVPAHIPATMRTSVTIRDKDPGAPSRFGIAHGIGATNGDVFDETIEIYPGILGVSLGSPTEIDLETAALVLQMQSQGISDPAMEEFAVKVFGRLLGENIAHEIGHTLVGLETDPTDTNGAHNNPSIPNDIMNLGSERTFTQRTGLTDTAHSSPVEPVNFTDAGVGAIDGFTATTKAVIDKYFPIPPTFV